MLLTETLPITITLPAPPVVEKQFNWLTVLQELVDGRTLSPSEHFDLARRGMSWPRCACGQLCKLLPKHADGRPKDDFLINYGAQFYSAIVQRDWSYALTLFKLIEKRTAVILEEMGYVN